MLAILATSSHASAAHPARGLTSADQPAFGWERPFAASFHFGFRTPLGTGVAYEVAPSYLIPLEVGAGVAYGGLQVGALARLRFPMRSMAFSLGVGLSRGPYRVDNADCVPIIGGCAADGPTIEYSWTAAAWRNYELSLERRTGGGFHWRLYFGARTLMNESSAQCAPIEGNPYPPARYCSPSGFATAYIGFSLGYAFFL